MDKYSDNELILMKNAAEIGLPYYWKSSQDLSKEAMTKVKNAFENQKQLLADIYFELDMRNVDYLKLYPDCKEWTFDEDLESRKK